MTTSLQQCFVSIGERPLWVVKQFCFEGRVPTNISYTIPKVESSDVYSHMLISCFQFRKGFVNKLKTTLQTIIIIKDPTTWFNKHHHYLVARMGYGKYLKNTFI